MRIQNIYCLALIAASLAVSGCTSTSTTQKAVAQNPNAYVGSWGGGVPTSIEIVTESPLVVRYCFKTKCSDHNPSGTTDNFTITFPPHGGKGKTTMNAAKVGTSYRGTFQSEGSTKVFRSAFTKPAQTLAPAEPVLTPAPAESALKPAQ